MKLVRDNIPELYPHHQYRQTEGDELAILLRLKLAEEVGEVLSAPTGVALIEELADVLEVVEALASHSLIPLSTLWEAAQLKQTLRGGFSKGWMLR